MFHDHSRPSTRFLQAQPWFAELPPPARERIAQCVCVRHGVKGDVLLRAGDRVAGMIPWYLTRGAPGGYAELVAADAQWLVPVPAGLSSEERSRCALARPGRASAF